MSDKNLFLVSWILKMIKIPGFLHHIALIPLLIIIITLQENPCSAKPIITCPNKTYVKYLQTSCNVTVYPKLCCRSLSIYTCEIKTNPQVLAHIALNVSLAATKTTSLVIKRLSKTQGLKPEESSALLDCRELTEDSSDELKSSITEMGRLRSSDFAFQISNIQTWVSAALTNYETCKDGFDGNDMDGEVKTTLLRHVVKVSHRISVALALVNSYASAKG